RWSSGYVAVRSFSAAHGAKRSAKASAIATMRRPGSVNGWISFNMLSSCEGGGGTQLPRPARWYSCDPEPRAVPGDDLVALAGRGLASAVSRAAPAAREQSRVPPAPPGDSYGPIDDGRLTTWTKHGCSPDEVARDARTGRPAEHRTPRSAINVSRHPKRGLEGVLKEFWRRHPLCGAGHRTR